MIKYDYEKHDGEMMIPLKENNMWTKVAIGIVVVVVVGAVAAFGYSLFDSLLLMK